ncbi:Aste57867_20953 [Aphanomyces stellatus]|uniref:Aste57867_20953 protein n=1 Tax=Aphanomyces stellatus TaxID=120398 RepID=A0A485LGA0_9STRA|nr:hypothetical protein As57867_020885 [Aphanomyces stellatus]VFT97629.1 Aste57867_20953 [Aphanomyces stellatus]
MNSKVRIRVVVRVRPQLPLEKLHSCATLKLDNQAVRLGVTESASKEFRFDHVLGPTATQSEVYDTAGVAQSIASVLEGYHATLFAYGQTGSGKTYTMEGFEYEKAAPRSADRPHTRAKIDVASDRLGVRSSLFDFPPLIPTVTQIVPRAILHLFDALKTAAVVKVSNKAYRVKSSFVQIYNEQILDLFNPTSKQCLKLRWAADQEFFVEDLTMIECLTAEVMLSNFTEGVKQKIMATTNMNAASSRSHCIYTIYVESIDLENPALVTMTKLCLVDLAGSERIVKTGATGVTLQESIGINKSLFVLRQVIQILSDEANNNQNGHLGSHSKTHVPYRDSKLTSLLKHSLGGNSITMMIVCLSPSDLNYEENLSTLQYAARAQQISNTPVKNAGEAHKVLVQQLRDTIRSLQTQLAEANATIERYEKLQKRRSFKNSDVRTPVNCIPVVPERAQTFSDLTNEPIADVPHETPHPRQAQMVQKQPVSLARSQWVKEQDALECGKEYMFQVHAMAQPLFCPAWFA